MNEDVSGYHFPSYNGIDILSFPNLITKTVRVRVTEFVFISYSASLGGGIHTFCSPPTHQNKKSPLYIFF